MWLCYHVDSQDVCESVCVCVCICVCVSLCAYVCVCVCVCESVRTCESACVCVSLCVSRVRTCESVCVCVSLCVRVYDEQSCSCLTVMGDACWLCQVRWRPSQDPHQTRKGNLSAPGEILWIIPTLGLWSESTLTTLNTPRFTNTSSLCLKQHPHMLNISMDWMDRKGSSKRKVTRFFFRVL